MVGDERTYPVQYEKSDRVRGGTNMTDSDFVKGGKRREARRGIVRRTAVLSLFALSLPGVFATTAAADKLSCLPVDGSVSTDSARQRT